MNLFLQILSQKTPFLNRYFCVSIPILCHIDTHSIDMYHTEFSRVSNISSKTEQNTENNILTLQFAFIIQY